MSTTNAYQSFLKSLEMAESLLDIEKDNYGNPPKASEQKAVQGLRGGAVVLMVAAFEYYLRELVMEMLDAITTKSDGIPFEKLPDEMRITSVFESLNLAMKGPRHQVAPPKLDRLSQIEASCKHIVAGNLDVDAIADTGSNPGSKTVTSLFKNLGIPTVLVKIKSKFQAKSRWGKPVADTFIADKLDEIVRNRHVVAHTANTLHLTRSELRAALKFLKVLGNVLELALQKHVVDIKAKAATP